MASICVISKMAQTSSNSYPSINSVNVCSLTAAEIPGDPDHYMFTLEARATNGGTTECIAFCR